MLKNVLLMCLIASLTGCSYFRPSRIDIEQGNIITEADVSKLHRGQSEASVREIMGNPVLINTFTGDRLDYIYYLRKGYNTINQQKLILIFRNGRVVDIIHG